MSRIKLTHFALALSDFLFHYLPDQRGLSQNTISSYSDALAQFLTYCEDKLKIKREKLTVNDLSLSMVEEFLNWLKNDKNCSISTRNQRHAALNSFFRYLKYKNPGYADYLKKYISSEKKCHPCSNEDALFCNRSQKPITRAGIA